MRIGILFGGTSREREIAFAGGRTVYDNLNKQLFKPVPIFVDSLGNLIALNWQYIYKGTIRDFYPPVEFLPETPNHFQAYIESLQDLKESQLQRIIDKVGQKVEWSDLSKLIDFAFLSLHGEYGEDGQLQGALEAIGMPYSGSGIRACSIGIDKAFQKKLMTLGGFESPDIFIIKRNQLTREDWFEKAKKEIGFPLVVRPANQGSSIGVAILKTADRTAFEEAISHAFFIKNIHQKDWNALGEDGQIKLAQELSDIRDGLGFPVTVDGLTIYHPEELLSHLQKTLQSKMTVQLVAHQSEKEVIIEGFIEGKEFSCIVAKKEDGTAIALPPTEIIKGSEVFDYRSKYLPGLSRKVTPIDLPNNTIESIRRECERLFDFFEFDTYARIDGFYSVNGKIILNDPNTTSGMLPSSFFFHQAAEIGLNPSQFLTYIIRTSLQDRIQNHTRIQPEWEKLLADLDHQIEALRQSSAEKTRIAVVLGGYSFERHISVESGRNIFEKLASSEKYEPLPVFLLGDEHRFELYQIPINLLLKDNADDIRDKILGFKKHDLVEQIKGECASITNKYASKHTVFEPRLLSVEQLKAEVDGVFIALHGRPGEDGNLQAKLDAVGLPYNGSGPDSSNVTINKYNTLQTLKKEGFTVTDQMISYKESYLANPKSTVAEILSAFELPFICKPLDDGCSSAVKLIKTEAQLNSFLATMYRSEEEIEESHKEILGLKHKEEFPRKDKVLIEALIQANGAHHFLEITGGLMTHYRNGELEYEIFEPSEALAGGEILSLEEKFLAGEGQNITPARFAPTKADYDEIAAQVKADLHRAAKVLNVQGYARIDAFVRVYENNKAETVIIEINSLPGMTPATCIFHQCAINGYKPYEFIDGILNFGFERLAH